MRNITEDHQRFFFIQVLFWLFFVFFSVPFFFAREVGWMCVGVVVLWSRGRGFPLELGGTGLFQCSQVYKN